MALTMATKVATVPNTRVATKAAGTQMKEVISAKKPQICACPQDVSFHSAVDRAGAQNERQRSHTGKVMADMKKNMKSIGMVTATAAASASFGA